MRSDEIWHLFDAIVATAYLDPSRPSPKHPEPSVTSTAGQRPTPHDQDRSSIFRRLTDDDPIVAAQARRTLEDHDQRNFDAVSEWLYEPDASPTPETTVPTSVEEPGEMARPGPSIVAEVRGPRVAEIEVDAADGSEADTAPPSDTEPPFVDDEWDLLDLEPHPSTSRDDVRTAGVDEATLEPEATTPSSDEPSGTVDTPVHTWDEVDDDWWTFDTSGVGPHEARPATRAYLHDIASKLVAEAGVRGDETHAYVDVVESLLERSEAGARRSALRLAVQAGYDPQVILVAGVVRDTWTETYDVSRLRLPWRLALDLVDAYDGVPSPEEVLMLLDEVRLDICQPYRKGPYRHLPRQLHVFVRSIVDDAEGEDGHGSAPDEALMRLGRGTS